MDIRCRKWSRNFNVLRLLYLLNIVLLNQEVRAARGDGSLKVVFAVNAGGQEHTDRNGIHYEADPLHNKVGIASDYGNHLLIIGRVPEQDEVLYRTERYHTQTFGYDLPIEEDGEYALIMKFCEVYFNEPNMKVFDVVLNKQHTIVSELDIFHQVGRGTAHEEYAYFTVLEGRLYYKEEESVVRNKQIRLEFIKGRFDNPKINAFALLRGDVEHIPRLSPISDDILPMDADMAVFHDRVSADSNAGTPHPPVPPVSTPHKQPTIPPKTIPAFDEDEELDSPGKLRKTSGPRQPSPYSMDEATVMLPVLIAIGAFVPLLFCLCKL